MSSKFSPAPKAANPKTADMLAPYIQSPHFDSEKRRSAKKTNEPTKLTKGSYDLITKLTLSLQEL
jgi:hypothetical protein